MSEWKDLYSEVRKRKMEALNKRDIVKAVEKHGNILAIEGEYEKPKNVLEHMYASKKEFLKVRRIRKDLKKISLEKFDMVLIGCSGKRIPTTTYSKIQRYVSQGGWLLTTDWAIERIVERIFPGYIRWNRRRTDDAVVSCQILKPSHPFLDGLLNEMQQSKWKSQGAKKEEFKWWLENRSYPIEVLNPNLVNVLISSRELELRWGSSPVFMYFDYGNNGGRVIHMISHTHLQKGGTKGKYASALILTNILDEKVSQKMGFGKRSSQDYVSNSENQKVWTNDNYITPDNINSDVGLASTTQVIEVDLNDPSFSFGARCTVCEYSFSDFSGKIYKCKECGSFYHQSCLERQMNEGICKNCGRILLW
ncbi:MAG: C1 domain-containing protein [Candidatus Lokiarchaeota archaeon]